MKLKLIVPIILFVLIINGVLAYDKTKETFSLEIGEPEISEQDGFEFITFEGSEQFIETGELVMPYALKFHRYPTGLSMQEVKIESYEEPVEIKANLPEADVTRFKERFCQIGYDYTEPFLDYTYGVLDKKVDYGVMIVPIEVVDCEEGIFKLYKNIKYSFTYVPNIGLGIIKADGPDSASPGEEIEVDVKMKKYILDNVDAKLVIRDDEEEVVVEKSITVTEGISTIKIPVTVPEVSRQGSHRFKVEHVERDIVRTEDYFDVDIRPFRFMIDVPDEILVNQPIRAKLKFDPVPEREFETEYYLSLNLGLKEYARSTGELILSNGEASIVQKTTGLKPDLYNLQLSVKIGEEVSTQSKSIKIVTELTDQKEKKQSSTTATIIAVVIAILFIIAVLVFVFKYMRKEE